jgi:hypothetical protein
VRDSRTVRLSPAEVISEAQLLAGVNGLLSCRTNLRAMEADTGVSRTTIADIRGGRRKISREVLMKIVSRYDPDAFDAWHDAWARIYGGRTEDTGTPPAERHAAPGSIDQGSTETDAAPPPSASPPANEPVPASSPLTGPVHATTGAQTDARPAAARRSRATRLLIGALVVETAVLAWVLVAPGVPFSHRATASNGSPSAPATGSHAGPGPCIGAAQDLRPAVVPPTGATLADVRLAGVGYFLQRDTDPPRMEIAAELTGPPPPGYRLYLLERADPTSHDSTPEHHSGNGRYYPETETQTSDRCVFVPQKEYGYSGFLGMRLRFFAVLAPLSLSGAFERDFRTLDGYADQDLAKYGVVQLGSFDASTTRP